MAKGSKSASGPAPSRRRSGVKTTAGPSRSQLDRNLITPRGKHGAETSALVGNLIERGAFIRDCAHHRSVPRVMPNELECRTLDPAIAPRNPRHHAEPVAVGDATVPGVKRKAAEPVEDRLAAVD